MKFEDQIKTWLQQGKLKKQQPQPKAIKVLLEKAMKDIDVGNKVIKIDFETAYTLSYNSMLKAGRALVLAKGYRTDDGGQHKTTVDFCGLVLQQGASGLIAAFDRLRRNRNTLNYDPYEAAEIELDEVKEALDSAKEFLEAVKQEIRL